MVDAPTGGALYDQKIQTLFDEMFPDHPFPVLPRATPVPDAADGALATAKGEPSRFLSRSVDVVQQGDYEKHLLAEKLEKINPGFGTDRSAMNVYTRQEIVFTITPLTMAVCIPSDKDMLRKKLSDSANVLQRYVGGYIAAILELLLEEYFDPAITTSAYSTESDILSFDWRLQTGTGTTFAGLFKHVAEQLLLDVHSALPNGLSTPMEEIYANSESQYKLDGTFVDFALLLEEPEQEFTKETPGTLNKVSGTFYQTYRLHNVYVEIKVKDANGHTVRNHAVKAIESIYRFDDGVSACYCLSHYADDTQASTATTTAFRLSSKFARVYETTVGNKWRAVPVARSVTTTFAPNNGQPQQQPRLALSRKSIVAYVDGNEYEVTADSGLLFETAEY